MLGAWQAHNTYTKTNVPYATTVCANTVYSQHLLFHRKLQLLGSGVSLPRSRQALWVLRLMNFLAEDTSQVFPSLQLETASAVSDATVGSLLLASSNPHPKYFCYSLFRILIRTNSSQATPHAETM